MSHIAGVDGGVRVLYLRRRPPNSPPPGTPITQTAPGAHPFTTRRGSRAGRPFTSWWPRLRWGDHHILFWIRTRPDCPGRRSTCRSLDPITRKESLLQNGLPKKHTLNSDGFYGNLSENVTRFRVVPRSERCAGEFGGLLYPHPEGGTPYPSLQVSNEWVKSSLLNRCVLLRYALSATEVFVCLFCGGG